MMIPPYRDNFRPSLYGSTLDDYIRNTVIADTPQDVRQLIRLYLWRLARSGTPCLPMVEQLLSELLADNLTLERVQIVSLTSWRNCVLSVRPNEVRADGGAADVWTAVKEWRTKATVLFLYLHEEPLALFANPSQAMQKEEENRLYFHKLKQTWPAQYQALYREKVDALLDEYNRLRHKQATTEEAEAEIQLRRLREALLDLTRFP